MQTSWIGIAAGLVVVLAAGAAAAQAPEAPPAAPPAAQAPGAGDDAERARALFERAVPLADQGQHEEACPLFAEAHALHPTAGTAMQRARCHELQGEKKEALALYKSVVAAPNARDNPERLEVASKRIAGLERLLAADEAAAAPAPPAGAAAPPASTPPPTPPPASKSSSSRVPAYIALGAGGAGLIVGTAFGVVALGEMGDVKDACDANVCADALEADRDAAVTKAWIANAGFGIAIVGAAVGVVLLVTAHDGDAAAAARVVDPARGLRLLF